MRLILTVVTSLLITSPAMANYADDKKLIQQTALDYIESQHLVVPARMDKALDEKLAKRTYWQKADGSEYVRETSRETMIWVAENYNKNGDKFPTIPKADIEILDIDNRVASVKLTADDWIDYMHLYKTNDNQWKIVNVLWQYHDENNHISKK